MYQGSVISSNTIFFKRPVQWHRNDQTGELDTETVTPCFASSIWTSDFATNTAVNKTNINVEREARIGRYRLAATILGTDDTHLCTRCVLSSQMKLDSISLLRCYPLFTICRFPRTFAKVLPTSRGSLPSLGERIAKETKKEKKKKKKERTRYKVSQDFANSVSLNASQTSVERAPKVNSPAKRESQ